MVRLIGALGGRRRAHVDPTGVVAPLDAGWELAWWIGADDRWRLPAREPAVRQTLVDGAPVVQTAMRVPGGDAVHRTFGIVGSGDPIVVEVEDASPAPFVVAFVVRGARTVALDGSVVHVDGRPALATARPPSRWAFGDNHAVEVEVCSGAARTGPFPGTRDRAGRLAAAFLHPVPHRTALRLALLSTSDGAVPDLRALPSSAEVAHGWRAHTDRGMRAELPDATVEDAVRAALAESLLDATSPKPSSAAVAALEDWGFDDEVRGAWARLGGGGRRRARRRAPITPKWEDVQQAAALGSAELLLALRAFLAHEDDSVVTAITQLPEGWRGASIDVRDAPTRQGAVSYSVRWHGDRPALLWQVPAGVTLRVPGLDASFESDAARGEALLAGVSAA